jgi:hypothetical protein
MKSSTNYWLEQVAQHHKEWVKIANLYKVDDYAYDKYLPAVLNNSQAPVKAEKSVLAESRVEVTGDKSAKANVTESDNNVVEIRRLAGLK